MRERLVHLSAVDDGQPHRKQGDETDLPGLLEGGEVVGGRRIRARDGAKVYSALDGRLAELDRKIREVHKALNENYEDWNLFVCADHGMAPVERRLNVLKILKKLPVKAAKDYVVFVNSTLVVLWYLTDRGRTVIERALPSIADTRVISDQERRERRIPTNRQWGDRMLAANPGVLFWPDYFHVKDSTIRGMHGYLDKSDEQYGMAIIANKAGSIGPSTFDPRTLIDVFPTLCDLVGFPVPPSAEGFSLLAKPARVLRVTPQTDKPMPLATAKA